MWISYLSLVLMDIDMWHACVAWYGRVCKLYLRSPCHVGTPKLPNITEQNRKTTWNKKSLESRPQFRTDHRKKNYRMLQSLFRVICRRCCRWNPWCPKVRLIRIFRIFRLSRYSMGCRGGVFRGWFRPGWRSGCVADTSISACVWNQLCKWGSFLYQRYTRSMQGS